MTTTLFISSAQCANKSSLGSTITIDLKQPIDTYNTAIRVLSSAFWYSFPNLTIARNNTKMRFSYNSISYLIQFKVGIYSLNDISETIVENLSTAGIPTDLITLIADEATNLISLRVKTSLAFSMDFDHADNVLFKTYLGFVGVAAGITNFYYDSVNRANLNVNNALYINCSFATGTYFNQNAGSNVIGVVYLDKPPNTLIKTENNIPVESKCSGGIINNFTIWITNEAGELLDMANENWDIVLDFVKLSV